MEGVEWIMEGGKWTQRFVERSQYDIKKANKTELEQTKLRIFEDFLKKL